VDPAGVAILAVVFVVVAYYYAKVGLRAAKRGAASDRPGVTVMGIAFAVLIVAVLAFSLTAAFGLLP
jgi:hypothetical protein